MVCVLAAMRVNPIMEDPLEGKAFGRQFALCDSCFWTATILDTRNRIVCPLCDNDSVSLIPLAINELCRLSLSAKSGLELSFSYSEKKLV